MKPNYPLYIVSKGRWESRLTHKTLTKMKVNHYMVVERQEYNKYKKVISSYCTLLILDKAYQDNYNTCDNLGNTKSKGPGPARNFAWDHSKSEWHWVMDDNIHGFYRFNKNMIIPVNDGVFFKCMEDFCNRFENVAMAGPNYEMFQSRRVKTPPFVLNTRIYSCNLIRNDVSFRWRGRYNEDTDLSLRMLKAGYCTIQFNAFLQKKKETQALKGGNTKEFYDKEGTRAKSEMQVKLHPDISKMVYKFGRIHHHVDYSKFKKNKLKKKNIKINSSINNYGMKVKKIN